MKCSKCGFRLDDNTTICPFCGHRQTVEDITNNINNNNTVTNNQNNNDYNNYNNQNNNDYNNYNNQYNNDYNNYNNQNNNYYSNYNTQTTNVYNTTNNINIDPQAQYSILEDIRYQANKKNAIWTIVLYYVVFYFVASFISGFILGFRIVNIALEYGYSVDDLNALIEIIMEKHPSEYYSIIATTNLISYLLLMTTTILLCRKHLIEDFSYVKSNVGEFFKSVFTGLGILYAVSIGTNLIMIILQLLLGLQEFSESTSANQEVINQMLTSSGFAATVTVLMTIVFAPVVEELVFRKSFFNLFKEKGWKAIIISGVVFGAIHVTEAIFAELQNVNPNMQVVLFELVGLISYAGSGIALGYIYKKNNYNIWVNILIHSLYNGISVLLFFIA